MPKCDFCSASFRPGEKRWKYTTGVVSTTLAVTDGDLPIPISQSDPWWAACRSCHEIIEAGDELKLARRCAMSFKQQRGMSFSERVALTLETQQQQFWELWRAIGSPPPEVFTQ